MTKPWRHRRILVTRPQVQAQPLIALLEAKGACVGSLPLLEIEIFSDHLDAQAILAALESANIAIFTSANAVRAINVWLDKTHRAWPSGVLAYAIGPGTLRALQHSGIYPSEIAPPPHNSEALLNTLVFTAGFANISLFTGEGGRGMIEPALAARGFKVTRIDCYRRRTRAISEDEYKRIFETPWDVLVVTSQEALKHLVEASAHDRHHTILTTQLLVFSEAARTLAKQFGFALDAWVVEAASDEGVVASLERHWAS